MNLVPQKFGKEAFFDNKTFYPEKLLTYNFWQWQLH